MNIFLNKIQQAHTELVNEKGDFSLFACVELAINKNEWDIVVCADWLPERKRAAIDIIVDKLERILEEDDFLNISRIIALNKDDPFYCELKEISKDIKENVHKNFTIAGLDVKEINILQMQSSKDAKFNDVQLEVSSSLLKHLELLLLYHTILEENAQKNFYNSSLEKVYQRDNYNYLLENDDISYDQRNVINFQKYKDKRQAA